jgi:endonuclease-3
MADSLKRTTSTRNSRVTMITSRTPPPVVKPEPASPSNAISDLEDRPTQVLTPSLRRSTRSTPLGKNGDSSKTTLDVSSYAYAPVTPSPRKRAKIEHIDVKPELKTPVKSERPILATPKSSTKKLPQLALEKPHKAPDRWEEQYRLIERMRKGIIAPVDDM